MYKLGIDIGGTKVNFGLLDKDNKLCLKHCIKTPHENGKDAIKEILNAVLVYLKENDIDIDSVSSCGIGIPGTVSRDKKTAQKVPNLNWENIPAAKIAENLLHIPVTLIQDSRAAAYGEYCCGAAQGKNVVICITLGTGIGTGIVIDGKIFDGGLGAAGELGHVPLVSDGRECGCGQKGCAEKYLAGLGLSLTAKEFYGDSGTSEMLFDRARIGESKAVKAINDVIKQLGTILVTAVNLLSPDCLLFSGGLSNERELLVNPLIDYIREHSYNLNNESRLKLEYAALGEDAPMIGAALIEENSGGRKKVKLSASIMCADLLHLSDDLKKIERAGIDYIHFDVMDGHFVPNLMLPPEMIKTIRRGTSLPLDIHLMTMHPENLIQKIDIQKGDIVSVHYESTPHIQSALSMIKSAGGKAALALNPSTPPEAVRECLNDIDIILIMTVNPGFSGQKMVPGSFDKIKRARNYLNSLGYEHIEIEADGNCSFENVPLMHKSGANIFVAGTSSVFKEGLSIEEGTNQLLNLIQ